MSAVTWEISETLIHSQAEAVAFAAALIEMSMWFQVIPYPDDEWSFETKAGESLPKIPRITNQAEAVLAAAALIDMLETAEAKKR